MTSKAADIATRMNECRVASFNADAAYEVAINMNLPAIHSISMHKREVLFTDGSLLRVLDTREAKKAGLTDYEYSLHSQDLLA